MPRTSTTCGNSAGTRSSRASPAAAGDAAAGGTYFAANCANCHSVSGDLKGIASKYERGDASGAGARPTAARGADQQRPAAAGRLRHLTLLERYSDDDVRNLVAYLQQTTP